MAATMKLIQKNTLASTSTTVVFSTIPQTYDDLLIIQSAKVNRTSGGQFGYVLCNINGAGLTSYGYNGVWMSPSTATTWQGPTSEVGAYMNFGATTANWESNAFGVAKIWFPKYRNSNAKQAFGKFGNGYNATGSTDSHILGIQHITSPVTAAITSIQLETDGNYFHIGTQFWLYGIKNS